MYITCKNDYGLLIDNRIKNVKREFSKNSREGGSHFRFRLFECIRREEVRYLYPRRKATLGRDYERRRVKKFRPLPFYTFCHSCRRQLSRRCAKERRNGSKWNEVLGVNQRNATVHWLVARFRPFSFLFLIRAWRTSLFHDDNRNSSSRNQWNKVKIFFS